MTTVEQHEAWHPSVRGTVPMTKTEILLLVGLPAFVIVGWVVLGDILFLPLAVAVALMVYWSSSSVHVWLILTILGHAVLFGQKTVGVSVSEVVFAIYFFGFLFLWYFDRLLVRGEAMTSVSGDRALFLFLLLATLSILLVLGHEGKLLLWLREYLVILGFLLYFPLREALRDPSARRWIYGAFFLLALGVAVKNFIQYRTGALVATFLWELVGARQTANEPLFMAVILASTAFWMVSERKGIRLLSLLFISLFSLALVLTFSRGYWVGTIFGGLVLLAFGEREERKKLASLLLIVSIAATGIILVFFYDIFIALIWTVFIRLFSTAAAVQDISITNRLAESAAVWKEILVNPIVGVGLGGEFSFYNLLRKTTQHTIYIHNAYLYLWYKLGIVGLITFLAAYGGKLLEGIRLARRDRDHRFRPFVLASVAILTSMLQVSLTSPQFYARDSILIITLCWGTIAAFKHQVQTTA